MQAMLRFITGLDIDQEKMEDQYRVDQLWYQMQ